LQEAVIDYISHIYASLDDGEYAFTPLAL
jgi:hypothetical protein